MRSDPSIARCKDLVKTYRSPSGQVPALAGITAEFPRGALTAVVGPSGSGKSSLLRLLAGIDRPTSGLVTVGDVDIASASAGDLRQLRRHHVGYVFQRPSDNFVSYLTVGEHLRLAARRRRAVALDPDRLLDDLGIGGRVDHLPSQLSGGEQQRGAFAQVVATGADLIVADEPTAELDSASARILLERLHALVEVGITFVLATHDSAVTRMADNVLELDHGVLRTRRDARRPATGASDGGAARDDSRHVWSAVRRTDESSAAAAARRDGDSAVGEPREKPGVVEVDGVVKTYQRGSEVVHALRGLSVRLFAGEVVGLVGRSGSGKTTLLNLLAGWEQADSGEIAWAGQEEWEGARRKVLPWREVAVVPQKLGLVDELTVRENIEYPARLAGTLAESAQTVDELIDGLGLARLQNRYPKETSLGEQQRTALARALVLSPRLLLADEPSGHQDKGWTERVFSALARTSAGGTACLVATHNEEVVPYLDRVLSIADGRLTGDTGPRAPALHEAESFEASAGGADRPRASTGDARSLGEPPRDEPPTEPSKGTPASDPHAEWRRP